jgi:2'-5' RNA ligase
MVRCFIGFLVPENVKEHIVKIQGEISKLPIVCKFVEVENLHVCLSFLGETDVVNEIIKTLDEICSNYKRFDVSIGKVRLIPNENYIRVLALDVSERTGNIEKISKDIVRQIGGDSKPPHLTLCRVKSISDKKNVIQKLKEMGIEKISFTVSAIQLIKSELRRAGPVYSVIHESKLKD